MKLEFTFFLLLSLFQIMGRVGREEEEGEWEGGSEEGGKEAGWKEGK